MIERPADCSGRRAHQAALAKSKGGGRYAGAREPVMPTRIDAPLRLLKYPLQTAKGQQRRRESFPLGRFRPLKRPKKPVRSQKAGIGFASVLPGRQFLSCQRGG